MICFTSATTSGCSSDVENTHAVITAYTDEEAAQDENNTVWEPGKENIPISKKENSSSANVPLSDIPEYSGSPYTVINNNVPYFQEEDLTTDPFEHYSSLDSLGRCGTAYANICKEIMPTEKRGEIGMVKPSGWHTIKYDTVDGKYLYNRCHLVGYQLSGENANEKNLITGTRYLNVQGMLPFENMVADYVKETGSHVLYRVTPVFDGDNLVASGVLMEAKSVEDKGEGIQFCVYCYNVQPGIEINYSDGTSREKEAESQDTAKKSNVTDAAYIGNRNTGKFHLPSCTSAGKISVQNKVIFGSRQEAVAGGYSPCGICRP